MIAEEIRQALGVEQGWLAAQRLVGDHVEIRFFPPEHDRSLAGILAKTTRASVGSEEWREAKDRAWADAVAEKERRVKASHPATRKRKKPGKQ